MTTLGLDTAAPRTVPARQPSRTDSPDSSPDAGTSGGSDWTCDNCATSNPARRRCRDCGTLRY